MTRAGSLLLACVSVALLLAGLSWPLRLAYERGRVYAPGSSLRSDESGARALFLLLEQQGARPQRLTLPAPEAVRGVLLSIAPQARPAGTQAELLDWVRAGNVLVLALGETEVGPRRAAPPSTPTPTPSPTPVSEPDKRARPRLRVENLDCTLGLELGRPVSGGVAASAPADSPLAPLLAGEAPPRAARAFAQWPRDARVWLGEAQAPVLLELTLGTGRVLALSDASWFTNAGLPQGARLRLARHLLGQPAGALLFDEYRHGLVEEPGLAYVLGRYRLLPSACALLLLLGLLAWASTPAEAPTELPRDEAPEVRDSLVETRAGLYARSLRPADALALLERDLRAGLGAHLRAAPAGENDGARLSWKRARRLVRERDPRAGERLAGLLEELAAARRAPPRGLRPLVPLAQRVARFLQEVR